MDSQRCIGGDGGFLDRLFKIPIIFCHWLSEIYKKEKKGEVLWMLFQIMCNESDYVMLHSAMNIRAENSVKMTQKMPQ